MKLVAALSALLAVAHANLVVHHRVFHPSFPDSKYLERGIISGTPRTLQPQPSESLTDHFNTFQEALLNLEDAEDALYQVSLGNEGDAQAKWDFSSVKICHLRKATAETFILHMSDEQKPYALDYFVSPIPSDGSCPRTKSKPVSSSKALKAFASSLQNLNTTILQTSAEVPAAPLLVAPPALSPEGEVVKPPPPKSFIQKYWMYMLALILVVLVATPEDAEQPKQG